MQLAQLLSSNLYICVNSTKMSEFRFSSSIYRLWEKLGYHHLAPPSLHYHGK
jgi:hypothetical protein